MTYQDRLEKLSLTGAPSLTHADLLNVIDAKGANNNKPSIADVEAVIGSTVWRVGSQACYTHAQAATAYQKRSSLIAAPARTVATSDVTALKAKVEFLSDTIKALARRVQQLEAEPTLMSTKSVTLDTQPANRF